MKKSRRLIAIVISIILSISTSSICYAKSDESIDIDKVLSKFGYSDELIKVWPTEDKEKVAKAILDNPDNVSFSTCVMEIDNISEIESIVNTSDEELISAGVSEDKIKEMRKEINNIRNANDSELKEEYGVDDTEIKVLRKALTVNPDYKIKDIENKVTASGSISTATMTYTQNGINYSSGTLLNIIMKLFIIGKVYTFCQHILIK